MEHSSLNLAHREHRRAQQHLHRRRFEEACHCHQLAVKHLQDAMTLTSSPRAIESLELQREYHIRQQQIVNLKKAQFEIVKKALDTKKQIMAHMKAKLIAADLQSPEPKSLQNAIYRTMEEADSLIQILTHRDDASRDEVDSMPKPVVKDVECTPPAPIEGNKMPKEEHVIIEELCTVNQQLRLLVEELMSQLEICENENKALRIRIDELEKCATKNLLDKQERHGLQVITDSTGGNYSPFVLSPISQLSPEVTDTRELPALAPLELPQFDIPVLLSGQKGPQASSGN